MCIRDRITLAPAVGGDVDRKAKRGKAVVPRALDEVVDPGVVAAHVELEGADGLRCRRRFLEAGLAHRREHLRHTELCRRARRGRRAPLDDRFQAADWREHHWKSDWFSKKI